MAKLHTSFYQGEQVAAIARQLLGKLLLTRIDGHLTSGLIVETEAYCGEKDRASHAYGGRRTARTEVMFGEGGRAYVYLCYGIHHLFNVVTAPEGIPHAVLIRALEPVSGLAKMLERGGKTKLDRTLTSGPGSLSRALGIHHRLHSGESLMGKTIWIEDSGNHINPADIIICSRVGVGYAKEDAFLPYRFYLRDNPWVSKAKGLEIKATPKQKG